jgi:DNA-binding SARP family transcriptional activator
MELTHMSALPPRGGSPSADGVRLNLLRHFELLAEERSIELPMSAQRVAAYLALCDHPVPRARVAATLWLDHTDERAAANLRSALWRLHRPGLFVVEARGGQLALSRGVAVDLHLATARAWRLLDGAEDLDDRHLTGDVLPDWYDDWLQMERERFRQLRLHALETLAERLAALGRHAQAIDAALAAVQVDPLRETAHNALITAYLAEGNRREAIHQYERYRGLLRKELDLEPLISLEELLLAGPPAPRRGARETSDRR